MPLKLFGTLNSQKPSSTHKTIAIAAGKGGVGKSSLTVNLALALYRLGYRVGVLDADVYGPSLRRMLPEQVLPSRQGDFILPAVSHGIELISMAHFKQDSKAAVVRAPIANGMVTQFLQQVKWGPLDYLLIDFPPGTGDVQITLSQKAALTGAILITTPQEVALMDVKKCLNMFEQVRVPVLGIVENMGYYEESSGVISYPMGKGGGKKLAETSGHLFLGTLPLHPLIGQALDEGRSLFEIPGSEAEKLQRSFLNIVEKIVDENSAKNASTLENFHPVDEYSFAVEWGDGSKSVYRLSDLQRACPCAACYDEETGRHKVARDEVPDALQAFGIERVGRYALKVHFKSGCSKGIYHFDYLRRLKECN